MNALDALAWMIVGAAVIFGILPLLFHENSDINPVRNYLKAVQVGITFVLIVAVLYGSIASICWALNRLVML